MADTISIDMANVLSYLRKRREEAASYLPSTNGGIDHKYYTGKVEAYDDALDKVTQVLTSHARSWVKFAHRLEQQVKYESTE